jgi:hypothetical protein
MEPLGEAGTCVVLGELLTMQATEDRETSEKVSIVSCLKPMAMKGLLVGKGGEGRPKGYVSPVSKLSYFRSVT